MKENLPKNIAVKLLPHFPTVLVGTGDKNKTNLITVAMVHVFSFDPPLIGVGISPKRYSFNLIQESMEFTINVPSADQVEKIMSCGKVSGREIDKFEKFNLTKEESKEISVPCIEEFPLNIECRLIQQIETGDHHWFIGEVVGGKKSTDYVRHNAILYWGGEFRIPRELIESV
ncbi:MAG: flavin reductase family protein [Thermoplasmatota archaeon]